jgi:predicted adenylyl cyclase CyaB
MSKEIEKRFYTYDRREVENKIKSLGGIRKGMYLFQILAFNQPPGYSLLRLRDEGHRITFTLKQKGADGYELEDEVNVSNFNNMRTILEKIGQTKKYLIQKVREIYNVNNSELVFDHYPGLPGYIEIESPTEEELFQLQKEFNLIDEPHREAGDLYLELYGITKDRPLLDLAFDNVHELFKKYITKNEEEMIRIVEGQQKLLEKVDNK